jgi:AcrR family transcriptional regulator
MPRTYASPLRAGQTEQTRERILAAFVELLADPETRDVTIPEIAERAGVAVRTAYRHFPTREDLFEAVNEWWKAAAAEPPRTPAEFPDYIRSLYTSFAKHEQLVRATRHSKPLQEARARRKPQQRKYLTKVLEPWTRHLDDVEARQALAVLHLLTGSEAWLTLHETWDLTPEQAGDAAAWAVETLAAQLRARKPIRPAR